MKAKNKNLSLAEKSLRVIRNMSAKEKEKLKSFFAKDNTPKGWLSIEDHLPQWLAKDFMQGYSTYKVRLQDGKEGFTSVTDHGTWYYAAKEAGITHWLNE